MTTTTNLHHNHDSGSTTLISPFNGGQQVDLQATTTTSTSSPCIISPIIDNSDYHQSLISSTNTTNSILSCNSSSTTTVITTSTSDHDEGGSTITYSILSKMWHYICAFLNLLFQIIKNENMFMFVDLDSTSPIITVDSTTTFPAFPNEIHQQPHYYHHQQQQPSTVPATDGTCDTTPQSSTLNTTTAINSTTTSSTTICKPSFSRKSSIVILVDSVSRSVTTGHDSTRKMSISLFEVDTPTSDICTVLDNCSSSMSDAVSTSTESSSSLLDIDFLCCNVNSFNSPTMLKKGASSPKLFSSNTLNPVRESLLFTKQNSTSKIFEGYHDSSGLRDDIFELRNRLDTFKFPFKSQ